MKIVQWRYVFCPVVVTWTQFRREMVISINTETWKTLYIFGLRVAMWRTES